MNTLQNFAAPTGRLLLAIMFFTSGLTKISQYAGTQGYMEAMGVPGLICLTSVQVCRTQQSWKTVIT